MLEMGTSGLMSGDGKRDNAPAFAPAPALDSTHFPCWSRGWARFSVLSPAGKTAGLASLRLARPALRAGLHGQDAHATPRPPLLHREAAKAPS